MAYRRSRIFRGSAATPPVRLRPVSGAAGAWAAVGAASVPAALGDDTDATYVYTNVTTPTLVFAVKLDGITALASDAGHILKFKGLCDAIAPRDVKLSLYRGNPYSGGVLVAEFTTTLSSTATDYQLAITEVEAATITDSDYNNNLYVRGEAL